LISFGYRESPLRIAFKRAPEANYHLSFLPWAAPWLMAFRAASRPELLVESARSMRPLFTQAVTEHETLLAEAGAGRYLRKNGWLKLYRTERAFAALMGTDWDAFSLYRLPRARDGQIETGVRVPPPTFEGSHLPAG
jgi:hypothetical protein